MLKLRNLFLVCLFALASLGYTSCKTTETVIVPEGPKAAELSKAKDERIAGLVAQVKTEQEAREMEQAQAALVAANLEGVLFAAQHVPTGLPRTAIEEEAKLGRERSPPPNPIELLKAKDRVIAILNGEVEKAKALYGQAFNEAEQAKAKIAEKDRALEAISTENQRLAGVIVQKDEEARLEREKHANDVKDREKKHQEEINKIRKDYESKERATWILWARIAGLGLIVGGAIVLAVFKMAGIGGGLIGSGVLVGLISIGIETLTAQWWWPYLCGLVFVAVVGLGCYAIYRLYRKHVLHDKLTAAIQDARDEDAAKGTKVFEEGIEPHLKYRLGDKTSKWGKEQIKTVVQLGLVDPKGEEMLKKG